jgi:polyhydroxyalkanoate synthesis regulator protein
MVPAREATTVHLYGNRRLFEPARGRYLTLDELMELADHGARIVVRDAQSGPDITDFILSPQPDRALATWPSPKDR